MVCTLNELPRGMRERIEQMPSQSGVQLGRDLRATVIDGDRVEIVSVNGREVTHEELK